MNIPNPISRLCFQFSHIWAHFKSKLSIRFWLRDKTEIWSPNWNKIVLKLDRIIQLGPGGSEQIEVDQKRDSNVLSHVIDKLFEILLLGLEPKCLRRFLNWIGAQSLNQIDTVGWWPFDIPVKGIRTSWINVVHVWYDYNLFDRFDLDCLLLSFWHCNNQHF